MYIDLMNTVEDIEYPIELAEKGDNSLFDGRNIAFESDINIKGIFVVNKDIVTVNATIAATLKGQCDKCLEDVIWEMKLPMNESFTSGSSEEGFTYTGSVVELSDAVAEKILLDLPNQLLCKNDCKGLCAKCGCDKNKKQCACNEDTDDKNPFAILKSIVGGAKNGSTKV